MPETTGILMGGPKWSEVDIMKTVMSGIGISHEVVNDMNLRKGYYDIKRTKCVLICC